MIISLNDFEINSLISEHDKQKVFLEHIIDMRKSKLNKNSKIEEKTKLKASINKLNFHTARIAELSRIRASKVLEESA